MKKRFSRDRLKAARGESPPVSPGDFLDLFEDDEDWTDGPAPEPDRTPAPRPEGGPALSASGLVEWEAGPEATGRRLDLVLAAGLPDFSRSQLARLAKEGLIMVDGRPAKAGQLLKAGQRLSFPPPEPPRTDLEPEPEVRLEVIYEDQEVLALNKPWGLAVHPAPGYRGPTVAGGLLARDPRLTEVGEKFRPGLVHRLDKDTSGVLITARTEPALRALAESFSRRETRKRYLAFVRGRPVKNRGLVEAPIGRHPTQRHKMAVVGSGGRPARTFYRLLKFFPASGVGLVLLTLVTGRTHQARVHLQSLGAPVLADPVYSRGVADLLSRFPGLAPGLQRQMLHARSLTIAHPATGRPLTLQAPWPEDFKFLLQALSALEISAAGTNHR